MARGVPDEGVILPTTSPEDQPRKLTPRAEAGPLGTAIEQGAEAVQRKYQADAATWAGDQLATLRVNAAAALETAKQNLPNGNPDGFAGNFMKQYGALAAPLAATAGGNFIARQMLQKGITDLGNTLSTHATEWESQQNVAYRANSVETNLAKQLPVIEAHPLLAGQVGSTLADQLRATGMEPSKLLPAMRSMDQQISLAAANGLTRQDPRGALQALNDPEHAPAIFQPVISHLTDAQREAVRAKANEHLADGVYSALETGSYRQAQVALLKNADLMDPKQSERLQQSINSAQEHAVVMADKYKRDASDSLLKNAILMQQQGKLTDAWIEKSHNVWEPAAYEYAKKLLAGKETVTDAPTYLTLLNRQTHGDDVRDETMAAASQGLLDKQDAAKLLEASGKEQPNWFKRGHDYIETAGQVSKLEPDPAKAQTLANMQRDWDNLARQRPNMTDDEADKASEGIVRRYQLVKATENLLTLPVPRYMQGTRIQPDLQGSKQATVKALQNGEIDETEFNKQAFLLEQWQHALDVSQQRKAAAAKAAAENK